MTAEQWKPKLPEWRTPVCIICGKQIDGSEYIGSKKRGGAIRYAHRHCFVEEQRKLKEEART